MDLKLGTDMRREDLNTEFKRHYVDDIKATAIAFANTQGGYLYVGIEDDGTVCGVSDPDGAVLQIQNALRDSITPDVMACVNCRGEEIDGKDVVVVEVKQGSQRPYFLRGKGLRPEGVFVRQGPSTVPADVNAIREMLMETAGSVFEKEVSYEQELSFDYTSRYFAQAAVAFGDQQKKTLGLVNKNGLYTNLALLLSDQCPYSLKAAVFQGTDKMIFRDRAEFEGSVLEQFDKALAFLEKHQSMRSVFQGAKRIDIPDYPMMAVREGLTNAVVHREYASTGPILMSIFADRLEILNQGGLLPNFTIDEVLRGVSEQRNEKLAAVFYRLGLLEGYGSGYSRMLSAYAGTGKKPEISVTRFSFMLTLPNVNGGLEDVSGRAVIREQPQQVVPAVSLEDLSERARERMQKVLQRCRQQPQITRAEAQDLLGVSQSTATLLLNAMVQRGLLVSVGSGPTKAYRPTGLA